VGEWIEIELVEEPTRQRHVALEPTAPKPPGDRPRRGPGLGGDNRRRGAIVAGVAVVVGVVWVVAQSGGDPSTSAPPATLDESSDSSPEQLAVETTQPRPSTTRPRSTTTTGPPLVVEQLGGPMLPAPSGLQLVGLTMRGDLLDIDLDTGEMTTTDVPGGSIGAQATLIAGDDWTYVQRWDVNSSFTVQRGQLPVDVTSTGDMSNGVYRGPEPGTLWTLRSDPTNGRIEGMELVAFDGEPLGRSVDLRGWYPMQSDLAGGVLVQTGSGVYSLSEAGARRVADGEIAGTGANHFLVRECDDTLECGLFVIDRNSGERRQVPDIRVDGMTQYWGWAGTDAASVSPDGTAAILFGLDGGMPNAALVETVSGAHVELTSMNNGAWSVAWSDDSRFVAYTDNSGLRVYDRTTGETIEFGDDVPPMASFVSRP
jgi:hypothetical protein